MPAFVTAEAVPIPVSTSWVLGFQMCTTVSGVQRKRFGIHLFSHYSESISIILSALFLFLFGFEIQEVELRDILSAMYKLKTICFCSKV